MDFGALLSLAKRKSDEAMKDEGKFYSSKYSPPKKERKESKQLSSNIQKFLKKLEEEKQERKRVNNDKITDVLAMSEEKSTKSENKLELEDVKIDKSTADQGDVDDYGYVSKEANAYYQKYIEKVKYIKDEKRFSPCVPKVLCDLSDTRNRVKMALTREEEDRMRRKLKEKSKEQRKKNGSIGSRNRMQPKGHIPKVRGRVSPTSDNVRLPGSFKTGAANASSIGNDSLKSTEKRSTGNGNNLLHNVRMPKSPISTTTKPTAEAKFTRDSCTGTTLATTSKTATARPTSITKGLRSSKPQASSDGAKEVNKGNTTRDLPTYYSGHKMAERSKKRIYFKESE